MQENRTEKIRQRAYAIWEAEGHPQGRDMDHWRQAERELDGGDGKVTMPATGEMAMPATGGTISSVPKTAGRPKISLSKSVAGKKQR